MADEPYDVPATGTVEYQRFVVDPGWTEDKWIKAMRVRAGQSGGRAPHHRVPGSAGRDAQRPGRPAAIELAGRVRPGLAASSPLDEGYARYVQKGSKLLFEMHYTPNGTAQTDRSYVGFVFADPKTVKKEVAVQNAGNFTFKIPPDDPNYEVESEFVFRQNALLLTVSPHMHVRGKDFRYDLIYPDGKQETVLWVPRYDFGWQTTYELTEPKQLPRGHEDALRGPLRQFGRQPCQSRSHARSRLGRADLGRNDVRLVRDGAGRSGSDAAGHRLGPAGQGILWHRPTRFGSTINCRRWPAARWKTTRRSSDSAGNCSSWFRKLDRVCVTSVENDKLRLKMLQERLGLKTSLPQPFDGRQGRPASRWPIMPWATRRSSTKRWPTPRARSWPTWPRRTSAPACTCRWKSTACAARSTSGAPKPARFRPRRPDCSSKSPG